jgi:hypothetical protein
MDRLRQAAPSQVDPPVHAKEYSSPGSKRPHKAEDACRIHIEHAFCHSYIRTKRSRISSAGYIQKKREARLCLFSDISADHPQLPFGIHLTVISDWVD